MIEINDYDLDYNGEYMYNLKKISTIKQQIGTRVGRMGDYYIQILLDINMNIFNLLNKITKITRVPNTKPRLFDNFKYYYIIESEDKFAYISHIEDELGCDYYTVISRNTYEELLRCPHVACKW